MLLKYCGVFFNLIWWKLNNVISLFSRFYCSNNKLRWRKFKLRRKMLLDVCSTYFAHAPKRLATPALIGAQKAEISRCWNQILNSSMSSMNKPKLNLIDVETDLSVSTRSVTIKIELGIVFQLMWTKARSTLV